LLSTFAFVLDLYCLCRSFLKELSVDNLTRDDCRNKKKEEAHASQTPANYASAQAKKKEERGICMLSRKRKTMNGRGKNTMYRFIPQGHAFRHRSDVRRASP
jgi:hypothetical protein